MLKILTDKLMNGFV